MKLKRFNFLFNDNSKNWTIPNKMPNKEFTI